MLRFEVQIVEPAEPATDPDEAPIVRDVLWLGEAHDEAGALDAAWAAWDHKYGERPTQVLRPQVHHLDD